MTATPALFPLSPAMSVLTQRVDLTRLYPPFAALYLECLEACLRRSTPYYCISGFRDDAEQEALYAKGRKKLADGSWVVVDASQIVTRAKPGESDHNFGVGADSCRDKDADRAGLQPGWAIADYEVLAQEAKRLGLNALYYSASFREGPHVGLDLARYGLSTKHLRAAHDRGGLSAAWALLDGYDWRTT